MRFPDEPFCITTFHQMACLNEVGPEDHSSSCLLSPRPLLPSTSPPAADGNRVDLDPAFMSMAHKTAIAKLPDVIEWLLEALGAPPG